jgi:PleD family two-component response regulator
MSPVLKRSSDFIGTVETSVDLNDPPVTPPTVLMQKRVLLIDDSPSVLRVTSRFLLMNGHTVVTAANGCQGLEILQETYGTEQFDLVITDMQMPGMSAILKFNFRVHFFPLHVTT